MSILKKLTFYGTEAYSEEREQRLNTISNLILLFAKGQFSAVILATLGFMTYYYSIQRYDLIRASINLAILPSLAAIIFFAVVYYLKNRNRRNVLGFISHFFGVLYIAYFSILLGADSGFFLYLFVLVPIPLFFIRPEWKNVIRLSVFFNLLIIFFILYWQRNHEAILELPPLILNIVYYTISIFVCIGLLAITYYFWSNFNRSEDRLLESRRELKHRNEIIESGLKRAEAIVTRLLPDTGLNAGPLKCRYRYQPAEIIGGDFFSFDRISEKEMSIFIGDVVGHGMPAALFLALIKSSIDVIAKKYKREPGRFIDELNSSLQHTTDYFFMTGIYAYCTLVSHGQAKVTLCRAGHSIPVLYRRKTGSCEYIKSPGAILGLLKEIYYHEIEITLEKGDRLFLYTDGLSEMSSDYKSFMSEKDFLTLFEKSTTPDLDETVDNVIHFAKNDCKVNSADDDIVLIGLELS